MKSCGNKTCNVSHINHKHCAVCMSDVCHCCKINFSRISGSTCYDKLWLNLIYLLCKSGKVDISLLVYTVRNKIEILARNICRRTVSEVSAVIKAHTHNGVARFKKCKINRCVCLCTGMRLNIGKLATEKFTSTLDSNFLNNINILASAVISL